MAGGQQGQQESGSRYQDNGRAASPGPVSGTPSGNSRSSPGAGRFSSWRAAGGQQRTGRGPQGWRAGRWPDPVPEGQQRQREAGSRSQGSGRAAGGWGRQQRAGTGCTQRWQVSRGTGKLSNGGMLYIPT
ncbi:hypothetical protein ACP86_06025 [Marinobacter sp. CP1]|nr:hypothetical protein ACP86_06025 [Marinobacter sp. CP1]